MIPHQGRVSFQSVSAVMTDANPAFVLALKDEMLLSASCFSEEEKRQKHDVGSDRLSGLVPCLVKWVPG